ncbi:hypothetical protein C1878_15110 [Gordonibacter sp. 28C]|nr:hypothetical protein C1878_15110 [Gordonibacter sp. 28C]
MPRAVIGLVAALVFGVFLFAAFEFARTVPLRILLVAVGAAFSSGTWFLLVSVNTPQAVAAIDVDALSGMDATLKEAAEAVNAVTALMDAARSADDPHGIAAQSGNMRALVGSMASLISLDEFASSRNDADHHLVFSLATSWLPDAWESLTTNVRYLAFNGKAAAKAQGNIREIERQCAVVGGSLDTIRANIVSGTSDRIETGADYLRQRLGSRPKTLSLDADAGES